MINQQPLLAPRARIPVRSRLDHVPCRPSRRALPRPGDPARPAAYRERLRRAVLAEERLLERALLRADDEAERDALVPFRNAQLLAGLGRRRIQIAPQHAGCVVRTRLLDCRRQPCV